MSSLSDPSRQKKQLAALKTALATLENCHAKLAERINAMGVVTTMLEKRSEPFGKRKTLLRILNISNAQAVVAGMEQSCIALSKALISVLPLGISTNTLQRALKKFVLASITVAFKTQSFDFCGGLFRWVDDSNFNAVVTASDLYKYIERTSQKLEVSSGALVGTLNQVFREKFAPSSKSNQTWNNNTNTGLDTNKTPSGSQPQVQAALVARNQLERNRVASLEQEEKVEAAFQTVLQRMVTGKKQQGLHSVEEYLLNENQSEEDRLRAALALRGTLSMNDLHEKVDLLMSMVSRVPVGRCELSELLTTPARPLPEVPPGMSPSPDRLEIVEALKKKAPLIDLSNLHHQENEENSGDNNGVRSGGQSQPSNPESKENFRSTLKADTGLFSNQLKNASLTLKKTRKRSPQRTPKTVKTPQQKTFVKKPAIFDQIEKASKLQKTPGKHSPGGTPAKPTRCLSGGDGTGLAEVLQRGLLRKFKTPLRSPSRSPSTWSSGDESGNDFSSPDCYDSGINTR